MQSFVGSRVVVAAVVTGLLLGAGCASMPAPRPAQAVAPGDWLLIITDSNGNLLGAVPYKHSMEAERITFRADEIIGAQPIDKVKPQKTFLAPGFQTITIFDMGDPCRYVIQGGQAVLKCTP